MLAPGSGVLLEQLSKNVQVTLELVSGRRLGKSRGQETKLRWS